MDKQRWGQVKEIFGAAIELPEDERERFVTETCGTDHQLLEELRRLLARHEKTVTGFLDRAPYGGSTMGMNIFASPPPFKLHDILGKRFRVDGLLGRGGMGEVYRAYDLELEDYVALKTIRGAIASRPKVLERFKAEVKRARRITSPYVCRVNDFFVHESERSKVPFLSMELLEGETLAENMRRKGALDQTEALPILQQICEGLQAAHSNRIIHGDLKPSNIMLVRSLDGSRRAVITDFGLAQAMDQVSDNGGEAPSLGTPDYMAPEQMRGQPISSATDIYALGLVGFEMLTAQLPWDDNTEATQEWRKLRPVFPSSVPPQWRSGLLKCLEENPENRYQTPLELAATLNPRQKISRRLWLAAASVAATAGTAGMLRWIGTPKRTPVIAVVPFRLRGDDAISGNAWFGDGFSEDLISAFARADNLDVIARESAFRYRQAELRQAGKVLGADYVLSGTVGRSAGNLMLEARLLEVGTGAISWSDQFSVPEHEVTAAQTRLAQGIASSFGLEKTFRPATSREPLPAARDKLYIGRLHFNRRLDEPLVKSIRHFREAVRLDPSFAEAFSALANAYLFVAERGLMPPTHVLPRARQAAIRSSELDPNLASAHGSLGQALSVWDRDFKAAEKEFRVALKLDSKGALAHQWYSYMLLKQKRFSESVSAALRAVELDPVAMPANANLAVIYQCTRDDAKMVRQCERLLELDSAIGLVHNMIALARARQGRGKEAIRQFNCDNRPFDHPHRLRNWCELNVLLGNRDEAVSAARLLAENRSRSDSVPSSYVAMAFAALGEADQAFHWIDRAIREFDRLVTLLQVHPAFDPIHRDPRYPAMLSRLGVPS